MSEFVTCLRRLGDNVKKYRIIVLSNRNEVTIGRSPDVTVCLLSNMISRCHATLQKSAEGDWTIKDNKSLNGVFVNDVKLTPLTPHLLQEGDKVQLGIPKTPQESAEFMFQFHKSIKIKRVNQRSSQDDLNNSEGDSGNMCPVKRMKLDPDHTDTKAGKSILKKCPTEKPECDQHLSRSHRDFGYSVEESNPKTQKATPSKNSSLFQEYKEKLKQQEDEACSKLKQYEAKMAEMQRLLQEKEAAQNEMKNELEEERKRRENQTKEMHVMLKEKEEQMELALKKKQEEEEKMKEELENQLLNREAQMLEQLQCQKDGLLLEKQKIEENLKLTIEEKNRQLEKELVSQKEKLESIINQKDAEQRMLESQLNDTRAEKDQQKEAMLQAREDILSNFADLMETELQCSICNELFVQATSLNCSHAFCSKCIKEWMKVKKECPNCRTPITSSVHSIVLDSYIDRMVEHLNEDLKKQRVELVAARKAEEEQSKAGTSGNTRGRGRGRGRGRVRGRRNNTDTAQASEPPVAPILIESDDEIDGGVLSGSSMESEDSFYTGRNSDESDSDDSDYVRGEPGAYFGGYGRCFRCGSRGHWANGCPFS